MTAHWSPEAEEEVDEIAATFIAIHSDRPLVAEQLIIDLHGKADRFARSPGMGSRHPNVPAPMRVLLHKRWVVVYEPNEDDEGITILRLIDGSRDFTQLF